MDSIIVKRLGDVFFSYSFSSIERVFPEMSDRGFKLCSMQDIARLRIVENAVNTDSRSSLFDEGPILTRDAVLCLPENIKDPPRARLIKNSPLLEPSTEFIPGKGIMFGPIKIAKRVNPSGLNGIEIYNKAVEELEKTNFFPDPRQISCSLEDSVKFPIFDQKDLGRIIDLKDFTRSKLFSSIFGGYLGMYMRSLELTGMNGIRVYPELLESINGFGKPFVKQIVYGKNDTADISIRTTILFEDIPFYIFGIKEAK